MSRTGLSVALLSMCLFLFYAALLNARATDAQTGGEMTDGTTSGTTGGTTDEGTTGGRTGGANCPGAETVLDNFTGSGDQQTETFDITGESFRVTFDVTNSTDDDEAVLFFNITVNEDNGDFVDTISQEGEGADSSIVNQAPGTFFLDVSAINVDYTITVEDCTGEDTQGGGTTDNTGGDGDANDDGVIDNTIPRKPLPDTGGSTATLVVGGSAFLLLYGALVTWRLKTRER